MIKFMEPMARAFSKIPRIAYLWAAGGVLLIALNINRDMTQLLKNFTWETVRKKTLHVSVSSPGVMEAIRVAEIKSEVDEVVLKKLVEEGDPVKEGQPLLELSRTRTQLEYEQKKNMFRNADSDYKKAASEQDIQEKLYNSKAVSRSQWEDSIRAKDRAKASRDIASRELQLMEKKLEGTLVRSPINGYVLKDKTILGAGVNPGKDLMVVGDISRFIVRTKVDELDIKQVRVGQPVEIYADAYPDVVMKGLVQSIAMQAEREAFAKVEVLIEISDARNVPLKHNLSVRTKILTDQIADAVGIPIRAIQKKQGDKAWVLVRDRMNLVREKQVILGRSAGDDVEVKSGLKDGASVGVRLVTSNDL